MCLCYNADRVDVFLSRFRFFAGIIFRLPVVGGDSINVTGREVNVIDVNFIYQLDKRRIPSTTIGKWCRLEAGVYLALGRRCVLVA